jgi:hypothetical protein
VTVGDVVITPKPDDNVVNGQPSTNVNILALSIKLQPTSFKVTTIPARATFTVEAIGGVGPYTYQWEYKTDKTLGGAWLEMPEPNARAIKAGTAKWLGSKTATLTVPVTKDNALDMTKVKFRCVITDAKGNKLTSNVVGLETNEIDSTSGVKLPISGRR